MSITVFTICGMHKTYPFESQHTSKKLNLRILQKHTSNSSSRALAAAFVVGTHAAFIWIVWLHSSVMTISPRLAPLTVVLLSTSNQSVKVSTVIVPNVFPARPIEIERPFLLLVDGANQTGTSTPGSGRITPPVPMGTFVDSSPFVKRAGLQKGSGVTVVLRVEVRGSGEVARVAVEVSSGTSEVDQAAIAYVRAMKWTGGLKDDKPETLWVRWGVRFDG